MSLIYTVGDLFSADEDCIAHGVNTVGVMGAGIAVGFKERYPEMYREYARMCKEGRFVIGDFYLYRASDRLVFNLATQEDPGPHAKLWAIHHVFQKIMRTNGEHYRSIAIPQIGCGIGGLKWEHVEGILLALTELQPAIVVYTLEPYNERH